LLRFDRSREIKAYFEELILVGLRLEKLGFYLGDFVGRGRHVGLIGLDIELLSKLRRD
jgi:hypothetical protein